MNYDKALKTLEEMFCNINNSKKSINIHYTTMVNGGGISLVISQSNGFQVNAVADSFENAIIKAFRNY